MTTHRQRLYNARRELENLIKKQDQHRSVIILHKGNISLSEKEIDRYEKLIDKLQEPIAKATEVVQEIEDEGLKIEGR